jgi:hypothetical protein
VANKVSRSALRQELELHLLSGRCAYCGARASPDRPLTREHLVPRSRGGGRHDHRIIVPACARCNYRRGCQDLILFLLARPCRISALLDHFSSLPADILRHVDTQIFAELYATLWVLEECMDAGAGWQARLKRLSGSRTVHRRRYAARRIMGSAGQRLVRARERSREPAGPSCLLLDTGHDMIALALGLAEPFSVARMRLLNLLSLAWSIPADEVETEIRSARQRLPTSEAKDADRWNSEAQRSPRRKRRLRIDQRRGSGSGGRRGGYYGKRAA